VLEVIHSLMSAWLGASEAQLLRSSELAQWLQATPIEFIAEAEAAPDPAAVAIVRQHLPARVVDDLQPIRQVHGIAGLAA